MSEAKKSLSVFDELLTKAQGVKEQVEKLADDIRNITATLIENTPSEVEEAREDCGGDFCSRMRRILNETSDKIAFANKEVNRLK